MGKKNEILGIDVGGTGLKAALIDVEKGELLTEKMRVLTPQPSTPKAVAKALGDMIDLFKYKGIIGCGFPSIIDKGVARSAANIDQGWIDKDVTRLFKRETGHTYYVANDADVAGLAEIKFGAGKGVKGTVIVLTIGTGIGSATFLDGDLLPNTEFGHLWYNNKPFEHHVSNAARKREDLSWEEWGERFNAYLEHLTTLFSPSLFILGGGASKKMDLFDDQLTISTKVVPAKFQNDAGVIGAAMYARSRSRKK